MQTMSPEIAAAPPGTTRRQATPKPIPSLPPCRPHPHLFQINTWVWLDALSRNAGRQITLAEIPDQEWDKIQAMGFDLVYLLGIWNRSLGGRHLFRTDLNAFHGFDHALPGWTIQNIVGSPFSITQYAPDTHIGDWAQVDAVRAKLAARGMRLILDFVPNHTGPDHPWATQHPDYLMQGTLADFQAHPSDFILMEPENAAPLFIARGRDPYFAPWADTAQIDHYNPAARAAMIDQLRTISQHADGVRCDMAMLVLNDVFARTWAHLLRDRAAPTTEFWSDAIAALPKDFIWIAEAYWDMEPQLQSLGFRHTYDKRLYDCLVSADSGATRAHLGQDIAVQTRMARFLENHDEPRAAATFGHARLPGLTTLIATLPGLRFFHDGQFDGKTIHIPMPLDCAAEEPHDSELAQTCTHILHIANHPVFHQGSWQLLQTQSAGDGSNNRLIAYRWKNAEQIRVVVLNMNQDAAQGWLQVANDLPLSDSYDFTDLLTDQNYPRDRNGLEDRGLYVRLEGFKAHVFAVSASTGS